MHSLLFFGSGEAALARTLVSGGEAIVTSAEPAEPPFALQAGTWLALSLMVSEARRRAGPAAEIAAVTPFTDRALPDAWTAFVAAADIWESQVRQDARTLAEDIVSYAKDLTPDLHRRLAALLGPLRARPPSLEEAKACGAILDTLRQGAEERARRAAALGGAISPFVTAAARLGEVIARGQRNPPVRIVLAHVPGMCLAYDDDGLACASDMKQADKRQHWMLEPSGEAYVLVSAADPDRVLVVDQDDGLIPLTRKPPPFTFVQHGPRPRVARRDEVPANAARFYVSVSPDLHIQNVNYQTLALDCPGEDGWRTGAPVVSYLKTGGASQRWAFSPALRARQELMFHDVVAPVGHWGRQVGGLQRLQDDWTSVAEDLSGGAAQVLLCVEQQRPFAMRGSVVDVLEQWRRLAAEARNACAGLNAQVS